MCVVVVGLGVDLVLGFSLFVVWFWFVVVVFVVCSFCCGVLGVVVVL